MDCSEVMDVLDAYALGAAEKGDAAALERHVSDCVRCWDELSKAQRTAALLALSIPLSEPPPRLEQRIMELAQGQRPQPAGASSGFFQRLGLGRAVTAGALGVAGLAAFGFSAMLQVQMNDLRDENGALERQVVAADTELAQQQQVSAVLAASDTQKLPISSIRVSNRAPTGTYTWSAAEGVGFLALRDLAPLPEQRVYQTWFTFGEQVWPAGTCVPLNGSCDFTVYFGFTRHLPDGIGVSVEPAGGSLTPAKPWQLFASFEEE